MREINIRYVLEKKGELKLITYSIDRIECSSEIFNFGLQGWIIKDRQLGTGFKDKNGKEGYHKDICMDEIWHLWFIEWVDENAGFALQPLGGAVRNWDMMWLGCIKDMVIVANACENPELLNATK